MPENQNNNPIQSNKLIHQMYGGLPANIFKKSSLSECLDVDLLNHSVEHYQNKNKIFLKNLYNIIEKGLNNKYPLTYCFEKIKLISGLESVNQKEFYTILKNIIEEGLNVKNNWDTRLIAIKSVRLLKKVDQKRIIQGWFESSWHFRFEAIRLITNLGSADQKKLYPKFKKVIEQGLDEKDNWRIRFEALLRSKHLTPEDQKILYPIINDTLHKALDAISDDIRIGIDAINLTGYLTPEDQKKLYPKFKKVIEQGLNNKDGHIRLHTIKLVRLLKKIDQEEFINLGLNDNDDDIKIESLTLLEGLCKGNQKRLKGNEINQQDVSVFQKENHGLYTHKGISHIIGSTNGSIINRGHFVGQAYQRKLPVQPFLVWKKAYESYETWKEYNRDYVPIEPIISFSMGSDSEVSVRSKVLHTTRYDFVMKPTLITSKYMKQLSEQIDKLDKDLRKMGIRHNDIHVKNICIQYYYTESGEIDVNRCPRIYLIDRDKAEFTYPFSSTM